MLKKPDKYFWIANLVIVLSLVVFFSRSIFTNRILAPGDFETYPFFVPRHLAPQDINLPLPDTIVQHIPWFHFDKQMLKQEKLPLWNPYQGCGTPHIANLQSALFYPLNIFVYLLNWKWGLFFLYFFKLYFIGLFLYFYLKEIEISPPVSILFAVSGMYVIFYIVLLYFPTTSAAFFLPSALWATELILNPGINLNSYSVSANSGIKPLSTSGNEGKQLKGYFVLCLGFAFALLGGNPEMVFYSIVILISYLFIRLYQTYKLKTYRGYLPVLSKYFIILFIGGMISSIQLLPFLEYFRVSSVFISRDLVNLPVFSLPGYFLLFNILPTNIVPALLELSNAFKYQTTPLFAYAGVSILLLSLIGIVSLSKDKIVKAYILILILIFLTGFNIPFIHTILENLPGFDIGRNYYMLSFLGFALIIISSKALDNFILGRIKLKSFVIATIAIFSFIIIFGLLFIKDTYPSMSFYVQRMVNNYLIISITATIIIVILTFLVLKIKNKIWLLIALGILIYAQTAAPMIFIEPAIKPEYFYPKNKIFSLLQREHGIPFRVTAPISSTLPIAYPTNINTFYDIEDIRNYDSLGVNWYNSIFSYIRESDVLNLTNVKYIIVKSGYDLSNLTNIFEPVTKYNGFILYKNLSAFKRAFMVYHYLIADSDQQALDLLHSYSGQLDKFAIVFQKDIQGMPMTAGTQETSAVTFIKYTPGYIKLSCTTSQPGLFFISDTYFPGWHARVDGKKTKIIRADYAFQGLWLTQGTHTIELDYDPASFKYGELLSIIGLLSLISFYLIVFRKKKL